MKMFPLIFECLLGGINLTFLCWLYLCHQTAAKLCWDLNCCCVILRWSFANTLIHAQEYTQSRANSSSSLFPCIFKASLNHVLNPIWRLQSKTIKSGETPRAANKAVTTPSNSPRLPMNRGNLHHQSNCSFHLLAAAGYFFPCAPRAVSIELD